MRFLLYLIEKMNSDGVELVNQSFAEISKNINLLNNVKRLTRTGTRSFLFKMNNGSVLKITDDRSIFNYYKYTLNNKNPHLLKFYNSAKARNTYEFKYNKFLNPDLYIFEMEPLEPISGKNKILVDTLEKESDKLIRSTKYRKRPNYEALLELVNTDSKYEPIKSIVLEWIKLFKDIKTYKFLDFKADNIMKRSNGTMVIIDPFYNPD